MKTLPTTFTFLFVACSSEAARPNLVETRDSAGVRIVENRAPAEDHVARLGEPSLRLTGAEHGAEPYFRVTDVAALADGGFVVAVNGLGELRFHNADGSLRAVSGRSGSGPGEFGYLSWLEPWHGDSVLAYDPRLQRLSVWTAAGERGRDVELELPAGLPEGRILAYTGPALYGVFADGTFLSAPPVALLAHGGEGMRTAVLPLMRHGASVELDTLLVVAGFDYYELANPAARPPMGEVGYARGLSQAIGVDRFIISENRSNRIDVYSPDGTMLRSIRVLRALDPVTAALRAAFTAEHEEPDAREPPIPAIFPDSMPVWQTLLLDGRGSIWAGRYPVADAVSRRWEVFSEDGVLEGVLEMPASFRPMAVRDGILYGVSRDSLDIEYIEVHSVPESLR